MLDSADCVNYGTTAEPTHKITSGMDPIALGFYLSGCIIHNPDVYLKVIEIVNTTHPIGEPIPLYPDILNLRFAFFDKEKERLIFGISS